MAVSEEPIQEPNDLIKTLGQMGREIGEVSKGLDEEDKIEVFKKTLETVDRFKEQPELKSLFRAI